MREYIVRRAPENLHPAALLSSGLWDNAAIAFITNFVEMKENAHTPHTTLRLLYDDDALYGKFQVKDQYVRCVAQNFQDPVCLDSCVEAFIEPAGNRGYINFEFSGSGVFLSQHIRDAKRTERGFADFDMLSLDDAAGIIAASTLPRLVEPEITTPIVWELGFKIPFAVFERRGFSAPSSGEKWRANFYKCGDKTSHPHWACWNEIDECNFHLPRCYGNVLFE